MSSNYFCVTPDQLSVISGEKVGGRRGEGEKGRRERGEPNNQVARSSEKFSAINLQILSNIFRDYFPFLLESPL